MKTTIIFILLLALAAGAFLSRPTQASYVDYVKAKASESGDNSVDKWMRSEGAEAYAKDLTYQDRFLWSQMRSSEGQLIALGLFSKWFPMGFSKSGSSSDQATPAATAADTTRPTHAMPTHPMPNR